MLICLNCGNTKKFEAVNTYKEYAEEVACIDGDTEDEYDYRDLKTIDSERVESEKHYCPVCDSKKVEISLTELERLKIMWEHTDKKGKWHKEELKEDKRNVKLGKKLFVENI